MSQLLLLNVKFPLGMPIVIFIASTSFRVASSEGDLSGSGRLALKNEESKCLL